MKNYNYLIEDEKAWEDFKKKYKDDGLGDNLNEAITNLIRKHNKGGTNGRR